MDADEIAKMAREDAKERTQDRPLWPHLENIDRIRVERPEWFDPSATWVITEKIHGFNARFGVDLDGTPWCGTRNNVVFEGDVTKWPHEAQQGFVGYAADHVMELLVGMTLFGEWAGKGIQKGIDYGEKDFYAFGMMMFDALVYWDALVDECHIRGIKTVPIIYFGSGLPSVEQLTEWRDGPSLIAAIDPRHPDGVAIPYIREGICLTQDPPAKDGWGNYLIGKFKGAAFSENARAARPLADLPDMTNICNFVADYATEVRLQHVLQQVAEEGTFHPLDVVFTGDVLRKMYNDVVREAGAEYEALSDADKKMLGKVLSTATKVLLEDARAEALK